MSCNVFRKNHLDFSFFLIYVMQIAILWQKKGRTPTGALPLPKKYKLIGWLLSQVTIYFSSNFSSACQCPDYKAGAAGGISRNENVGWIFWLLWP